MKKSATPQKAPKKASKETSNHAERVLRPSPTVVGIGASAGGLAALKGFFHHIPADSGLAYVVVVHLSPEHESHLADVLRPHLKMPVDQVTESVELEADHVYVIPPNANLDTIDSHLRLSQLEEHRRERAPINHFFRTLANTHDGHAIAVVLTGTGSDGALGIKDIKALGGFVFVQDPNEAEYNGMPQNAIETGFADLVLPVAKIAQTVVRFARTRPPPVSNDTEKIAESEERILQKIFAQLRARTERDFSRYKRSTLLRRIGRRMQLHSSESLEEYLAKLRDEPEEARVLADDLLVPVTHFFRDADVFKKLEKDVIQSLFRGRNENDPIRVWSVGCATGEEAYSLAMLLVEEAARRDAHTPIQIFATDLHEPSLAKAREGAYPGDIAVDVSAERLQRFFQMEKGGYRINKEIRDLVIFAPHNLLGDPPFSRLDFIACRNLLIYLQREVQRDAIDVFHYALRPDGWLLLGTAETIDAEELFRTEEKKLRFYRKRNVPAPEPPLPVFPPARPHLSIGLGAPKKEPVPQPVSSATVLQRMVERHGPPCLLIGRDYKLAQVAGNAGRYLLHPPGEPTHNVFQLVRKELRVELRAVVQAVREKNGPLDSKPIPVRFNGSPHPVIMHVRPGVGRDQEGFVLVIFEEVGPQHAAAEADEKPGAGDSGGRVQELEAELENSQQRLQAIFEKFETSQEEMKASNEEMQSANEELRSTMEELETSKEELQSINEELQTVNQENRHKVDELSQLSGVLQNLLAATDIATLFLDRNLRIIRFTPKVSELFNVQPTDRGRPLSDLTHRLGYDELKSDAKAVLSRLTSVEREVHDEAGRCYLTRLLPYRSVDDHIEGVVITFVDITRRLEAEEKLRESEQRYRLLVDNAREYAIFLLDLNGCIASWNAGAERLFGYAEQEIVGRPFFDLFSEEDRAAGVPQAELETARRTGTATNDGWRVRKDGSRFWGSGAMETLASRDGELRGFSKVLRDNSERREAEESLRQFAQTLETRVEEQTREVRDLSARLTMAEHRERDRIARILHDDLQQLLYSIKMQMMFLRESLTDSSGYGDLAARVEKTEELLGDGIRIAQRLAVDLSPQVLDKQGLREMVRWLGDHMKEQHGLEVALKAKNSIAAPKALRVLLFQTVRELLFNVIKHAGVKQATVDLRQVDGEFLIQVSDRGKGFDVGGLNPDAGFGVSSVSHRILFMGGRMRIDSEPGKGTTVTIGVPMEALEDKSP